MMSDNAAMMLGIVWIKILNCIKSFFKANQAFYKIIMLIYKNIL